MRVRKWLMRQQWRILQIRGIWGVFYGVLIIAGLYVEYVPFFNDMGAVGPFAFAATILFAFLIVGYIYDRVLVMWAPSQEVTQERNPYMYVPSPKDHIFWFPLYSTIIDATEKLAEKVGADTAALKETREYYARIQALKPERREDLDEGIRLRQEFIRNHPFSDVFDNE